MAAYAVSCAILGMWPWTKGAYKVFSAETTSKQSGFGRLEITVNLTG